ncbi:MAG TPA: glycosyltransferase family 1 protein [Anaerolineae bacterium]|nr:glycosyltransferase family 1 protein [Anaerolineae bacterium]
MHIVLNGWFWGQMNAGSGQYLHHLAQHLPVVGAEHRYTLVLSEASAIPVPSGWQVVIAPPAARQLGTNPAKLWFEQVSFPGACRRLGADITFTPYWGAPWQRPCPGAVTVHDLIPLLLPAYRGGALQRAYTWLASQTARRADLVLTDSQASRQDIVRRLGIPAERVHAVLLAADEGFQPVSDPAELARVRERYALPGGRGDPAPTDQFPAPTDRFILYLGGFDVRKNVAGLVRAYAKLPSFGKDGNFADSSIRLVIAGQLPEADTPFTPDPRRMVAEAGIADLVHFTGWVDEADKPALYSLASLFVFPSLYEGFGLPVAEAAACGAPVLTSNRSSLPEAAPGALLVDPEDVDALAAAMAQAMQSPRPGLPDPRRTWLDVTRETLTLFKELS